MKRSNRGLTFLEVMVVVVILGIMIAIALPAMRGPQESAALKTAARDFVSAGLYARQTAIVQGHKTYLLLEPKTREWRMHLTPPEEKRYTWSKEEREPTKADENMRKLPQHISYAQINRGDEKLELGETEIELTFFPNGSSSGLAIQVANTRNKSLTVEFDQSTGRPEVYSGEPKSMATKLKEAGIDPALYGLSEDPVAQTEVAGSGFKRTAGMNEDERVKYYEDAVQRMLSKSRNQYKSEKEGGPGAAYTGAQAWGGGGKR